jgi:cell wall-associated NlpC family hydrolase
MKNKLTKITSGFIFAVFTATICSPAATAAPVINTPSPGSSFISQNSVDQTGLNESPTNKTPSDLAVKGFSATIVLNEASGPQIIDVTGNERSLSSLLKAHGFDVSDFRSSGDTALDENYQVKDSENLSLFKSEASGTSSVVNLPAPEIKKESADVPVGEEKVVSEGKSGTALRTVITTKNLALDTKINTSAKKSNADESSEEKLTILTAPEPKVILVGTKVKETTPETVSTPSSSTSASATINVAPSSKSESTSVAKPSVAKSPEIGTNSALINLVKAQIGKSYVWGASGPNSFDCSGLVQWIFAKNFGYDIPRTAYAQGLAGTPVNPSDIQPGDIVYTSYHIGIYVGDGKMVHAASPETGVIMDDVKNYLSTGYKVSRL